MARLNNLLVATTAMVALAASVASADTIEANGTTTLYTSNSVGGLNISGTSVVSVTGAAAVEISGTVATQVSNTLNISSSATLRSDQVSGTVAIMPDSGGAVTINNSGTIVNTATNGYAISGTSSLGAITIRNTGTISGSIDTSSSADVLHNAGTINGNVHLRNGNNQLTQTAGSINGNINMGTGADNILVSGGLINGNINTGDGTDYISVTGAGTRINGNINLGDGDDSLDIINGAVISATTIDGGAGNDTLRYLNGTYTTFGAINNVENIRVSNSTVNLNHGTGGHVANLTVDRGATLNVGNNTGHELTSNGTLNVAGTLNIRAGSHISASTVSFANGGVLGIHIDSSSSYGRIERVGTGSFTGGSLTIHLGNNYINNGTQFAIVSATGGTGVTATPSLTTTTHGLYTYSISTTGANEGISLTINRAATASAALNNTNAAIGNVLDNVSSSTNVKLAAIQGLINAQTTTAGVNRVLEKLNPAVDTGAAMAAVDVATQTGGQVSTRLAGLRQGNSMNTGDGMFSNHFWMQGFGNVTEQDDKDGRRGYDANTYGASFGLDTDTLLSGATTGLAFSYGKTNVQSNNTNGAETDVDNYLITLYGSRVYDQGFFINALGSVGFGSYETSRNSGIGNVSGDFDGMQYSAKVEAGRDINADWWTITPAVSAQYTYVDMDSYTETGPGAALRVDSDSFNAIDFGAGVQAAYNIPLESGGTFGPRMRAKVIYRTGDDSMETNSRFVAGGAAFKTQGVKADRTSLNLGAGVLLSTVGGVDLSMDYDADIRNSLTGHTGQLKARWAF